MTSPPGCAPTTRRPCSRSAARGHVSTNPATDFKMQPGDDAVVVAESLGTLAPLRLAQD